MEKGSGRKTENESETINVENGDTGEAVSENVSEVVTAGAEADAATGSVSALPERPDPAAIAGIQIQRTVTAQAPNKEAVATYFRALADELEAANGGEAMGRGAKHKALAQGEARGLRVAAEFLEGVTLTG